MATKSNLAEAVVVERTFNAPVGRVWKALTDADEMRVWYFDLKEFKPEVGFEFEFIIEHEGMKYHHLCKVTEVIPQKRIAYTWRYKGEPGDSLVTFELFADGNKTKLRLTHEGLELSRKLRLMRGKISRLVGQASLRSCNSLWKGKHDSERIEQARK